MDTGIPRKSLVFLLLFFLHNAWGQKTIYFSEYLSRYKDTSLAFYKDLEACKAEKAHKLVIPRSTYHCHPERAYQQYREISNNGNGIKRIALPIIDQQNLEIDGQGSRIILHGVMMGAVIESSKNVKVTGLEFDWAKPFYAQGKVTAVDTTQKTFDLEFASDVVYRVVKDEVLFTSHGREYGISKNFWFDPANGYPVYNLTKIAPKHWDTRKESHYQVEDLGDQNIRVRNELEPLPKVGWHFIAKWKNLQYRVNRSAPGIHMRNAFRVTLYDVKVFSAAGMGIVGERSGDITLERVQVVPTPGTDRVVSATADATHFVNCKGKVILKDCVFESNLDDGLNIHGNYAEVYEVLDSHTLGVKLMHRQQAGYEFAAAGDTLRVIDKKTLLSTGQYLVVEDVEYINDEYFEILVQDPTEGISTGMGLDNISWTAELEMTGCSIGKNWARSVLVKTPGRSIVTHNRFYSAMQGIRNWGDMTWFYESGNVTDVLVSNNEFIDLCRVGAGFPVIVIYPQIKERQANAGHYYNHNIRITDNVIRAFDRGILYAFSVDGLTFENNTIIRTETFEPLFPSLPVIEIENCKAVTIHQNRYEGKPTADIVIDSISQPYSRVKNNKGFTYKTANDP